MPILSINLSIGSARCLLFEQKGKIKTFEIPLGFSNASNNDISGILSYILKEIEEESGINIAKNIPILIVGDNIQGLKNQNEVYVYSPFEVLDSFPNPILNIERNVLFFLNKMLYPSINEEGIARWLTFDETLGNIRNHLENLKVYNQIIPQSRRDVLLSSAILREKIISSLGTFSWDAKTLKKPLHVSGSSISEIPDLNILSLSLIDSLNFIGKLEIIFDREGMLINSAAINIFDKKMFGDVLSTINLSNLGSALCIPDDISVNLDFGAEEVQHFDIRKGSLHTIPLNKFESVKITVDSKKYGRIEEEVLGGEVGAVMDTREKPIDLDLSSNKRKSMIESWGKILNVEHIE